ncbi:hypothetical protein LJC46_01990 [Desulfovibrio sp. OttesenSCG-928-G15]|nr:hypothetical protein [Desulfovibrio sp. OttesenSCG-928-G15]
MRTSLIIALATLSLLVTPCLALAKDGKSNTSHRYNYHGNTESKVFHYKDCQYFKCKSCTEKFETISDAKRHGYKACGQCIDEKKQ